ELEVVRGTDLARNVNQNGPLIMGDQRLRVLDEQGIDIQVLSHQGAWWSGLDRDVSTKLMKIMNEGVAKWCAAHPDRFVGLASVSLQHPDLAAQQLDDAVRKMGLKGVGISGHADGEVPSTPKFDPFWAKVQELGVLVFTHPAGSDNIIKENGLR